MLVSAFKSGAKEVDKTSESYQRAKTAIEKGIETEVKVDSEELDALEGKEYSGGTVTITMPEESKKVVQSASDFIDELNTTDFAKNLEIDGDSSKAEAALAAIDTAIGTLLSGEGDGNSIAQLEAAIAACEELQITPGLDETTYAEVEAKLNTLKEAVAAIKEASTTFTYTDATTEADKAAWEAFSSAVESWGAEGKTLEATGKFTITGASTDEINNYASALAAAAMATSDYGDAVDNLNSVLEQEMQRQMEQVITDANEQVKELAIVYNSGGMSTEDYLAQVDTITSGAKETIEALEAETEAKKENNEVFANGKAADDSEAYAMQMADLYSGESISWESTQEYLTALKEAKESGADMSELSVTAGAALNGLAAKSVEVFDQMTQATDQYNAAMEEVKEKEQEAAAESAIAESGYALDEHLNRLNNFLTTFEGQEALGSGDFIGGYVDSLGLAAEEAAALKEQLTGLFTDGEGNMPENTTNAYMEAIDEQIANVGEQIAEHEANAAALTEEAATAAEEAATAYQTSMQTIQDESGLTAEAMAGALDTIAATGATIPEETQQQIEAVAGSLDVVNATLADGSSAAAETVSGMMQEVGNKKTESEKQGKSIGNAIIDGIKAGMRAKALSLKNTATAIANSIPEWMRKILGINSPSRVMRDLIGKNIMAGITAGIEDEAPSTYSALKTGLGKIVSGAQSVINRGAYSFPTAQLATSAGGMNYSSLGEALSAAVQDAPVSLIIKDKVIAQTTSDATARNQTIRAQRINRGKGRW